MMNKEEIIKTQKSLLIFEPKNDLFVAVAI